VEVATRLHFHIVAKDEIGRFVVNPLEDIRPITLQVSAIGGEGGGVLASWIVAAAQHAGYPVQSTSIPGVAQRTGATIYYLEVFPVPIANLNGKRPVLALYPGVGDIDIMLASEFAEAGRAISNGFVTPDRTHLIASTHRVYAIDERSNMADGRYDTDRLYTAAEERTKASYLADYRQLAQAKGISLNAVLLGVLASIDILPMTKADYLFAIEQSGLAVGSNAQGFEIGFNHEFEKNRAASGATSVTAETNESSSSKLQSRVHDEFPIFCHAVLLEGITRLSHYQDTDYAAQYLDRLAPIWKKENDADGFGEVTAETGRQLALRMSYEDVIRVAQLKSAPDRLERIREEVGAKQDEPVVVVDYLKPGIDELCSILPATFGRWVMGFAERRGWQDKGNFGLHLKSTTVTGYLQLRFLASLKRWRRGTYRYTEEQASIETWLADVEAGLDLDPHLALEIVECARLIKGYGDTHRRGTSNFNIIRDKAILPALSNRLAIEGAADVIANARAAALSDPEGTRLADMTEEIENSVSSTVAD
tara:strand:- start:26571 stop:28178 length:1608 start_codon:yes stop_codon:yes gene_type:complete